MTQLSWNRVGFECETGEPVAERALLGASERLPYNKAKAIRARDCESSLPTSVDLSVTADCFSVDNLTEVTRAEACDLYSASLAPNPRPNTAKAKSRIAPWPAKDTEILG